MHNTLIRGAAASGWKRNSLRRAMNADTSLALAIVCTPRDRHGIYVCSPRLRREGYPHPCAVRGKPRVHFARRAAQMSPCVSTSPRESFSIQRPKFSWLHRYRTMGRKAPYSIRLHEILSYVNSRADKPVAVMCTRCIWLVLETSPVLPVHINVSDRKGGYCTK